MVNECMIGYERQDESVTTGWWAPGNPLTWSFITELMNDNDVMKVWVREHRYPFMRTEGSSSLGAAIYLKEAMLPSAADDEPEE